MDVCVIVSSRSGRYHLDSGVAMDSDARELLWRNGGDGERNRAGVSAVTDEDLRDRELEAKVQAVPDEATYRTRERGLSVTEASTAGRQSPPGEPELAPHRPRLARDLAVGLAYTLAGVYVTSQLWLQLDNRMVAMSKDQVFFMWVLRHGARVLTMGENPFFTDQINAPNGVNLIANSSCLGLALPMAPVTVLFGARVSFAVLLVVGLAGTAFAWYKVLQRVVVSPTAAVVGGAFCGFAPGMISHATGHINWVAHFLVPVLVLTTLKLAEPGKGIRRGILLGTLATFQVFINEEILLYTAIGCAVFLAAYGAFLWRAHADRVRTYAARIACRVGIGAGVAAPLLAYPLYLQFFGRQAYHGLPGLGQTGSDLLAYPSFPELSLIGTGGNTPLALNITEQNSFFGWPLLLIVMVGFAWLWSRIVVRAIAVTAAFFFILSLGPTLVAARREVGIPLPWAVLERVPLLASVLPTRFSLALAPLMGITLALIVQRITDLADRSHRRAAYVVLAGALAPLLPAPLQTYEFPPTPTFITSGAWKDYVPADRALVPVPPNSFEQPTAMEWLADTNADFAIPRGYFIGPDDQGHGYFGAFPTRPTTLVLLQIGDTGKIPPITDQLRRDFLADLSYWRASAMVMPLNVQHAQQLYSFVDELTGAAGQQVNDVMVWRLAPSP